MCRRGTIVTRTIYPIFHAPAIPGPRNTDTAALRYKLVDCPAQEQESYLYKCIKLTTIVLDKINYFNLKKHKTTEILYTKF